MLKHYKYINKIRKRAPMLLRKGVPILLPVSNICCAKNIITCAFLISSFNVTRRRITNNIFCSFAGESPKMKSYQPKPSFKRPGDSWEVIIAKQNFVNVLLVTKQTIFNIQSS